MCFCLCRRPFVRVRDFAKKLRLTIRNCTHEESLNNLHIIMAEFDTLMKTHNTEKKKLHEHILVLRQECKKQAIQLEAQVRQSSLLIMIMSPRLITVFPKHTRFRKRCAMPPCRLHILIDKLLSELRRPNWHTTL